MKIFFNSDYWLFSELFRFEASFLNISYNFILNSFSILTIVCFLNLFDLRPLSMSFLIFRHFGFCVCFRYFLRFWILKMVCSLNFFNLRLLLWGFEFLVFRCFWGHFWVLIFFENIIINIFILTIVCLLNFYHLSFLVFFQF